MIKFNKIKSPHNPKSTIILIPGGPGLSSNTLMNLDRLSDTFDLIYVDLPGTNNNPYDPSLSFSKISFEIEKLTMDLGPSTTVLLGHSYGGYFAIDIASRIQTQAVICMGTPLSNKSFQFAVQNYSKYMNDELAESEKNWNADPSDKNFSHWLSSYGKMYFYHSSNQNFVKNDRASGKLFLKLSNENIEIDNILKKFNQYKGIKVFISGDSDLLLNLEILKSDAQKNDFNFISIENASHFMNMDNELAVIRAIRNGLKL